MASKFFKNSNAVCQFRPEQLTLEYQIIQQIDHSSSIFWELCTQSKKCGCLICDYKKMNISHNLSGNTNMIFVQSLNGDKQKDFRLKKSNVFEILQDAEQKSPRSRRQRNSSEIPLTRAVDFALYLLIRNLDLTRLSFLPSASTLRSYLQNGFICLQNFSQVIILHNTKLILK